MGEGGASRSSLGLDLLVHSRASLSRHIPGASSARDRDLIGKTGYKPFCGPD